MQATLADDGKALPPCFTSTETLLLESIFSNGAASIISKSTTSTPSQPRSKRRDPPPRITIPRGAPPSKAAKRSERHSSPVNFDALARPKALKPTSFVIYHPRSEGEVSIERLEMMVSEKEEEARMLMEEKKRKVERDWKKREALRFCGADELGRIWIELLNIQYDGNYLAQSTESNLLRASFCPEQSCIEWTISYQEEQHHTNVPFSQIFSLELDPRDSSLRINLFLLSPYPLQPFLLSPYILHLRDPSHVYSILSVISPHFPHLESLLKLSSTPSPVLNAPKSTFIYDAYSPDGIAHSQFTPEWDVARTPTYFRSPQRRCDEYYPQLATPLSPPEDYCDFSSGSDTCVTPFPQEPSLMFFDASATKYTPPTTPFDDTRENWWMGSLPSPEWVGETFE